MHYIVIKIDIDKQCSEYLDSYDSRKGALEHMMSVINSDYKQYYNKLRSDVIIDVYKLNTGYVYNTKVLKFVFQILEIDKDKSPTPSPPSYAEVVKNKADFCKVKDGKM